MEKSKKCFAALCCGVVLAAALTGCESDKERLQREAAEAEARAKEAAEQVEGLEKILEDYEEAYKNNQAYLESSKESGLEPGTYWCMGKNDTCKNKTTSPTDLYCSSCDPDGDNIEG